MIESEADDRSVDAVLRQVPGAPRLPRSAEALFDDATIDRILRNVPCPSGVADRLLAMERMPGRIDLDAVASGGAMRHGPAVRAAGAPVDLREARGDRAGRRGIGGLVARAARDLAAVAVVLCVAVATFVGGSAISNRLSDAGTANRRALKKIVGEVAGAGAVASRTRMPRESPELTGPLEHGDSEHGSFAAKSGTQPRESSPDGAETVERRPSSEHVAMTARSEEADGDADRRTGDGEGSGFVRGAPASSSARAFQTGGMRVPTMARAPRRGIPVDRGYDLGFELAHGMTPFADPSVRSLAVHVPPLSLRTDGFDAYAANWAANLAAGGAANLAANWAARGLSQQALTKAVSNLPVEDILAALRPNAVQPADVPSAPVRIRMAGCPSVCERPAARLLEVAVTAPSRPSTASHNAEDLIIVMDASAAPGGPEIWPSMVRGLRDAVESIGSDVRVSVVLCADRNVVAASEASPAAVAARCGELEGLRPAGTCDLHAALELVRRRFGGTGAALPRRYVVVAHAGTVERAERDGDPLLAAWRAAGVAGSGDASAAVTVVRIDPAAAPVDAGGGSGGSLIEGVPLEASAVRRRVADAVAGSPRPHLENGRLEVAFDPSVVSAYRLVGHRRRVTDLSADPPVAVDLYPGETVRVVYEVVLKKASGTVAKASFLFRSQDGSQERRIDASMSASDVMRDPPSRDAVWATWLAVGLTELASGSPHLQSPTRTLERVRERLERWSVDQDSDPATARLLDIARAVVGQDAGRGPRSIRSNGASIDRFDEGN